jgi:effector-binding domain-containing protein
MNTSTRLIETPHIVQTAAVHTACIHLVVPSTEIQNVMGPGIREVMTTVAAQGLTPTGPWFTHHLKITPAQWDFEICVPVAKPVSAAGRVQPGIWPAMKVVRTHYRGPFENLGEAWGQFDTWTESNGLTTSEELWEVYVAGPETGPDSSKWTTQLNRQLTK